MHALCHIVYEYVIARLWFFQRDTSAYRAPNQINFLSSICNIRLFSHYWKICQYIQEACLYSFLFFYFIHETLCHHAPDWFISQVKRMNGPVRTSQNSCDGKRRNSIHLLFSLHFSLWITHTHIHFSFLSWCAHQFLLEYISARFKYSRAMRDPPTAPAASVRPRLGLLYACCFNHPVW